MGDVPIGSLGLLLDIFGAALIYQYGLPNHVSINQVDEPPLEDLVARQYRTPKYNKHKCLSKLGIILLIIGFLLQIVDNHIGFLLQIVDNLTT